jgi:WD40-like Beta Propeller Repeat
MNRSSLRRRSVRAALLTAGVACLAAPTAMADSIVYIDGGNVWSAAPDGSAKVQLTDGGQWHSPTQADDGTIAAVNGTGPIQVMTRDGRPVRSITTTEAHSGDGGTFAPRPVDLAFSPDGSKIAYTYVAYSCPVASSCGTIQRSTFYTDANVTTATPIETYGNQYSVGSPSWVTNTRTLVSGGAGSQVAIDDLGPGDYSQKAWMTPAADMGDPEVSRDGKHLATTFDYGENTVVAFFSVNGNVATETPPAQPDAVANTAKDAQNSDPTWSPDGWGVAYHSSKGIEAAHFTRLDASGYDVDKEWVLTPTGSEPDWGPVNPPAARFAPFGSGAGGGGGTPGGGGVTPGAGKGALKLVGAPRKASAKALRKGLTIKVKVPAAGKVTVKLGKVAKGTAKARSAGTVKVRLSKVSKRQAAKLRGRKLVLTVKQAGAATLSRTVKIR